MPGTASMASGETGDDTTFHVKTSLRDYDDEGLTGMPLDTGTESHLTFDTKRRANVCALAYYLNYEHIYDLEEDQVVEVDLFSRTGDSTEYLGRIMG
jgi:hypothetical protein